MSNLKPIIEESFGQYSGAVLQSRALVDVRDCIKPSARQIFYCMETDKFTHDKPFRKTLKAIGSAMRMYIHGDSSCEGVIMRAGQPFAFRYPLVEVEGSYGNLMESGNWSAPRYTSARLSGLASNLFQDIDKNTIDDWRDNYDDTEKYPGVLPSKGYYNICNGSFGIGIGLGSSIPQFNLTEVNNALIKLINNPDIKDEELICMPDFATGAILLNASEVKESLLKGNGKACQLRAVMDYDAKDNCLVVTEIPYGVYTNTICGELEQLLENEETNPGIDRFNDLTGQTPLIKIYLHKGADVPTITRFLYKNTSLQHWYAVNMTMLQNGKYPKVFTWKEALTEHIQHERLIYTRGYEFDKQKIEHRLHIVEGLLIALANIDEVIRVIKSSASVSDAAKALQTSFLLDEIQAKAILDMKLSRLAHLEVEKLEKEKRDLNKQLEDILNILHNPRLLDIQIINGFYATINKYGDKRRTRVINAEDTVENEEVQTKPVVNLILNNNSILPLDLDDKIQLNKKGSPFAKYTVECGYITTNTGVSYIFDKLGKMYRINNSMLDIGTTNPTTIEGQVVCGISELTKEYLITVSRNGVVKKTVIGEYTKSSRSAPAVKIRENDELIYAGCAANTDFLYLLGAKGGLVKVAVSSINPTGRLTIGSKGIDDMVVAATIASDTDSILSLADGKGKFTLGKEYNITAKGGKGQTITEGTNVIAAIGECAYVVEKNTKLTKYSKRSLATKGKTASGAKITEDKNVKIIV